MILTRLASRLTRVGLLDSMDSPALRVCARESSRCVFLTLANAPSIAPSGGRDNEVESYADTARRARRALPALLPGPRCHSCRRSFRVWIVRGRVLTGGRFDATWAAAACPCLLLNAFGWSRCSSRAVHCSSATCANAPPRERFL